MQVSNSVTSQDSSYLWKRKAHWWEGACGGFRSAGNVVSCPRMELHGCLACKTHWAAYSCLGTFLCAFHTYTSIKSCLIKTLTEQYKLLWNEHKGLMRGKGNKRGDHVGLEITGCSSKESQGSLCSIMRSQHRVPQTKNQTHHLRILEQVQTIS